MVSDPRENKRVLPTGYWAMVPVLDQTTPIPVTAVDEGKVITRESFALNAESGSEPISPTKHISIFIDSPPDGAVAQLYR